MNMISVLIVEDEADNRDLLIKFVANHPDLKLTGLAENGEEALTKLKGREYELVFMDIGLPDRSGLEVLEDLEHLPYIIFTTAFQEYAARAYDIGAVDYLVKPFTLNRFNKSVERALMFINQNKSRLKPLRELGLTLQENDKYFLISHDEIIYLSTHDRYTVAHTTTREYRTSRYIKEIAEKLPEDRFVRIHRQFIVNLNYLSHIHYDAGGRYLAYLKDEDESCLPVGRSYAARLKEALEI